jgi:osmoprotectant transport system substrate-binding protein
MKRTTLAKLLALLAAVALLLTACGDDSDDGGSSGTAGGGEKSGPTIRIRGQEFSESVTLAEVYGQYLESKGYDVEILTPAGFRTEALDALKNDDVDLIIDYIGGDQAALAPDEAPSMDPDAVMKVITPKLDELGTTILPYSPAVDGDALVVRGDFDGTKISDLKGKGVVFGAASECYERPQCYIGLTDPAKYGIEFESTKTIENGPLLGEALKAKEVDAVIWNTTAPEIKENGFKVLEDDQGLFPAQNIAPIIRTEVLDAYGEDLRNDLDRLTQTITTDDLMAWNSSTDIDKKESDDVAKDWLESKNLI